MRFGCKFSAVPDHLVTVYREQVPKRKKQRLDVNILRPDDHQKLQILRLFTGIRVDAFVDFVNTFKGSLAEVRKLMTGNFIVHEHPFGKYCVYSATRIDHNSGQSVAIYVLYEGEVMLACGGSIELYLYARKYCARAAGLITKVSRERYLPSSYIEDLEESLDVARDFRDISPGMDRLTKVAQLDKVDQDHPLAYKFRESYDRDGPIAVMCEQQFDPILYAVDPEDVFGKNDDPPVDCDEYYISNLSGKHGLEISSDYLKSVGLAKDLYDEGKRVHLDANVSIDVGMKLMRYYKPRPHNLQAVLTLDKSGRAINFNKVREKVREANERRNKRLIAAELGVARKPLLFTAKEVSAVIARRVVPTIEAPALAEFKSSLRIDRILQHREHRAKKRYKLWIKRCLKHEYDSSHSWALLNQDLVRTGFLDKLDPVLGSINYSFHSVVNSAHYYGFGVGYTDVGWKCYRN